MFANPHFPQLLCFNRFDFCQMNDVHFTTRNIYRSPWLRICFHFLRFCLLYFILYSKVYISEFVGPVIVVTSSQHRRTNHNRLQTCLKTAVKRKTDIFYSDCNLSTSNFVSYIDLCTRRLCCHGISQVISSLNI